MRRISVVFLLAVALLSLDAWSPGSGVDALSTTNIAIGDKFFCSPAYEAGVCPTTVNAGDTVTWTYVSGGSAHTTTSSPYWDSGVMTAGGSYSFAFTTPGTFSYLCNVHPNKMKGTITVLAASQPSSPTQPSSSSQPSTGSQAQTSGFTPPPALGPGSLPLPQGAGPGALPSGGGPPLLGNEPSLWWLVILAGASFIACAGALTFFSLRHHWTRNNCPHP